MKVRRSVCSFLVPFIWPVLIGYQFIRTPDEVISIIGIVSLIPWLVIIANMVVNPYAFVIEREMLTYFPGLFRKKAVALSDIVAIDAQQSPFGFSYIQLKNGSKIKFDYLSTSEKQLLEAMRKLDIPVV
jgi:hypothetical protein